MSRLSSHDRTVTILDSAEVLEVIQDHASVTPSSTTINSPSTEQRTEGDDRNRIIICPCKGINFLDNLSPSLMLYRFMKFFYNL